uniref:Putative secreted protein n=1 Tax=Ixodes ricinus TaxID=34613 RepID=A0A147BN36_IXORI
MLLWRHYHLSLKIALTLLVLVILLVMGRTSAESKIRHRIFGSGKAEFLPNFFKDSAKIRQKYIVARPKK